MASEQFDCGASSADADDFVVALEDPRSDEAAELMGRLTYELAARYEFLYDGVGDFAPEDLLGEAAGFLVGRVDGRAVACAGFRTMGPGVAEVKRVFVAPEHRGRGYAVRILAELERRASARGYGLLRLETGDRQQESIALYERLGYRRIPNFPPYVGSDWSVCFEKYLSTACGADPLPGKPSSG